MSKEIDLFNSVKNSEIKNVKKKNQENSELNKSTSKQKRIAELVYEINRHRYLYYNGEPEVSDARYDSLEAELKELDLDNIIFSTVGKDRSSLFSKKGHLIPMGSQDKVTSPEEFFKWCKKNNYPQYITQFKLDGISIELQYRSGIFQCAVSRGDGLVGDDVSQNVMLMKGFAPKLETEFTGAVRAEVLMYRDVYRQKYTEKQNCRNACAGIVRRKDGKGCEDLNIVYYDAISLDDVVEFGNEVQKLKWLKDNGLEVVKTKIFRSQKEVVNYREDIMSSIRDSLNIDIDGLVIKGKEIDLEDMKRARPTKQIAFKFAAEEIETTLIDVEWSVSGANYTPIAIVEPVRLMGTTVQRASLANPDLIDGLGLKIGSIVMISKRGDIIPKIERVLKNPEKAKEIEIPDICETCGSKLVNEGTRLYCPNENCPNRLYRRIVKWIKKLGVKHFSKKLMLKKLFESGKVKKIADLYDLKVSDLTKFENVKEKSASKALNNLFEIKEITLARFVAGFNIEGMDEALVQRVVDAGYDTLEKLRNANTGELARIDGFGDIYGETLIEGVINLYDEMLELLSKNKIKIKVNNKKEGKKMAGKLDGLTFCFTGKLETMKRAEAEEKVRELGGVPKKSVVKDLSYLVTNDITPTVKYIKAQKQGSQIISEQEFLEMVE
ncbi:MAG: NAD-dependent DNA ligase LigA [Promethearchaeota archaeon]